MDPYQQQAMGYAPMAGGYAPQYRYGLEGAPLVSKNPLVGMAASPFLMNMMGGMNMTPMGLGHDQNTWDILKHREFSSMQRQAMSDASAMDRQNFMRTFRGVAAMSGQEYGASQRRAAGTLADAAQFAAPIMAQIAPDMLDQLGGLRGSATVMASRMIEGGRYRMDPATGRMGMSAETIGQQSREMFEQLYGDKANVGQMKGVTAGQAGSLFQELQMRGMVGQDTRSMGDKTTDVVRGMTPEQLQKAAARQKMTLPAGGVDKLTAEDIDKLSIDPAVSEKMRAIDTGRISKSIKNYAGAVSAMREIFGDQGRPNAPMSELMRGLEQLTGGNLAQMDPAKAGMIARQTYNLAKSTGVSIDNAMMIQGHASQHAAALGIESQFGVSATQHALAFGGAYRARGEGSVTAWGAMNSDQITQLDANLTTSASGSNMANRLGAAVRIADSVGGFKKGTEAANLIEAIKTGRKEFRGADGKFKSVAMSEEEITHTLTGAVGANDKKVGITQSDVQEMFTQQFNNREQVDKYNIGTNIVRGLQGEKQVMPFIADRLHETMVEKLKETGVGEGNAKEAMSKVSSEVTKQIFSMPTADFNDPQKFKARFQQIMETQLAGTAAGKQMATMSTEERNQFYGLAAERWKGQTNLALRDSGFAGLENIGNVQRIFNPETMAAGERNQQRQLFTGQLQDALSPLGKGTALSRAMQFLQNAKSTDSVEELVATAFGGVKNEDVNKSLVAPLQQLQKKRAELEELQAKIISEPQGEARDKMQTEHDAKMKELTDQASDLAKVSQDFGYFGEGGVTGKQTKEALSASVDVSRDVAETASLRGSFGKQVDRAELDEVKKNYRTKNPVTSTQAAAAIVARRHAAIEKMRTDPNEIKRESLDAVIAANKSRGVVLTDDQAKQEVINNRIALWSTKGTKNLSGITADDIKLEMEKGELTTDDEARAVILADRQATGLRPSRAAVEALIKEGKSPAEAEELASARQRAKRWGFTREIEEARKAAEANKTPFDERKKLGELVERHERDLFKVSDDDVKVRIKAMKDKGETVDEVKDVAAVRGKMLEERFQHRYESFGKFWQSPDGLKARDNVQRMEDAVQTIAEGIITTESSKRFGTKGIQTHKRLTEIDNQRKELALKYAGGDTAKLLNMDVTMFKDEATYLRVQKEVRELQGEQAGIVSMIHESDGKLGRQFWKGGEDDAKNAIGPKAAGESKEEYDKRIVARQEQVGNMKEAHLLMGMSEEEMKRLEEGKGEKLNPIDFARRVLLKKQAEGVGIARKMTGEDERVVRAVMKAGTSATPEQQADMKKIADRIGVPSEALAATVTGVIDPQMKAAQSYYDRSRESGEDRLARVGSVFGIDKDDLTGKEGKKIAQAIGSQSRFGSDALVATETSLQGAVQGSQKKFANVGELGKAYNEATVGVTDDKQRTENLNKLRANLHIGDDAKWDKVRSSLEFQQQQGLLERDKDGKVSIDKLGKAYESIEQGGQRLPKTDDGKGGSKWDNVKFTGTLTIKGSQAEIDGASSGNPLNPVTPK